MIWHKKILNDDNSINVLAKYNQGFEMNSMVGLTSVSEYTLGLKTILNHKVEDIPTISELNINRNILKKQNDSEIYLELMIAEDFAYGYKNYDPSEDFLTKFLSFETFFENKTVDLSLENLLQLKYGLEASKNLNIQSFDYAKNI